MKPLEGLKVLELARILAGPWVGQLLADLGADVVKVERPGAGDDTRGLGAALRRGSRRRRSLGRLFPFLQPRQALDRRRFRDARGAGARAQARAHADVVIENFKVGGLKKYGLDYESLKAVNPRLVYCSITGFGQDGPYAPRAGYDFMIQGMGGIMDLTGDPDGEPQKIGVAYRGHLHRGLCGRRHPRGPAPARRDGRGRASRHGAARRPDQRARQPGA